MSLPKLRLVLASASPARLATLRAAGADPVVEVSGVDEDAVLEAVRGGPAQRVLALATAKARAVAGRIYAEPEGARAGAAQASGTASGVQAAGDGEDADGLAPGEALVLGCDSMFEFDGQAVGKPHDPGVARERLARMSGRSGVLHTGHCLVHPRSGATLGAVSHAVIHIGELSRQEIDGILATMVDSRTLHSREVLERLEQAFGEQLFDTRIRRTIKFPDASVANEPITSYAPSHPGADAYRRLAREVIARGDVA